MKKLKKIVLSLVFMLLVGMWCTQSVEAATKESARSSSEKMDLSKDKLTLVVGNNATLKVENTKKKIKWSSSNEKVATVTEKGVVKAKKAGTAIIKAKVAGKTFTCKVTVKNIGANAKAKSLKFKTVTGGEFVKGYAKAKGSFKLNVTSTNVKVDVLDASGKVVYTKIFAKCKKDDETTFIWDGKKTNGKYVKEGRYRICVTAGTKKTYSKELKFCSQEFAGGDGSKSNPYQVSDIAQLKAVTKHNGMSFIQTADLDFKNKALSPLCSKDAPFYGTYDGNNRTISNMNNIFEGYTGVGIFAAVGEKGTVKNIVVKDSVIKGQSSVAVIAGFNDGVIRKCKVISCNITGTGTDIGGICGYNTKRTVNCEIKDSVIFGSRESNMTIGGCVGYNKGTIDGFSISTTKVMSNTWGLYPDVRIGGVCGWNDTGIIMNSQGEDYIVSASGTNRCYAGGVTGVNNGTIQDCDVKISSIKTGDNNGFLVYIGGVAGTNSSLIMDCSFEGWDYTTGSNSGTII